MSRNCRIWEINDLKFLFQLSFVNKPLKLFKIFLAFFLSVDFCVDWSLNAWRTWFCGEDEKQVIQKAEGREVWKGSVPGFFLMKVPPGAVGRLRAYLTLFVFRFLLGGFFVLLVRCWLDWHMHSMPEFASWKGPSTMVTVHLAGLRECPITETQKNLLEKWGELISAILPYAIILKLNKFPPLFWNLKFPTIFSFPPLSALRWTQTFL